MNKVYVVDYELVSPISVGKSNLKNALETNITADKIISRIDVAGLPFKAGAEIKATLNSHYVNEDKYIQQLCEVDRKFELIVSASNIAFKRFSEIIKNVDSKKASVILGVGADATPYEHFAQEVQDFFSQGLNPINELNVLLNNSSNKYHILNNPYEVYAKYVAEKFETEGFTKSILTACVASTQAIAFGFDAIQRNESDVVIAGGTDSIINILALISFGKLGVIVETKDEINCRPFDVNRSGTLAGEASGLVLLCSEKIVNELNLKPIAELTGYGNTLDGYKITAPDPSGNQMAKAISNALQMSNLLPEEINYIQAHGTGTRQNDSTELNAIKTALREHSNNVIISGTKDRHGHAIAAAGVQELCVLLNCMENNYLPSNLHLKQPIDESLNLIRDNRSIHINYALTCNFAFGGINTVLALKNVTT